MRNKTETEKKMKYTKAVAEHIKDWPQSWCSTAPVVWNAPSHSPGDDTGVKHLTILKLKQKHSLKKKNFIN